jgi:hypothetical protein
MAKKTIYTVPSVPGSKRTSARPYTHAIVGQHNKIESRARVDNADYRKMLLKNWQYNFDTAQKKPGDLIHVQSYQPWSYALSEETHAACVAFIENNPNGPAFVEQEVAARLAAIGSEDAGDVEVLQWSMSQANAMKGTGKFQLSYVNVHVVQCVPA